MSKPCLWSIRQQKQWSKLRNYMIWYDVIIWYDLCMYIYIYIHIVYMIICIYIYVYLSYLPRNHQEGQTQIYCKQNNQKSHASSFIASYIHLQQIAFFSENQGTKWPWKWAPANCRSAPWPRWDLKKKFNFCGSQRVTKFYLKMVGIYEPQIRRFYGSKIQ